MERCDGVLCWAGRIVEADVDLRGEREGISCSRRRGRFYRAVERLLARCCAAAAGPADALPGACSTRSKNGHRCCNLKPENKVSLGFVEGLNNKIRVIQRRAYGLRDQEYLRLNVLIKRFALENVRADSSSWVVRHIHHRRPPEFSELLPTGSLKRLCAHATAGPHR
jgi:hypothetical protein